MSRFYSFRRQLILPLFVLPLLFAGCGDDKKDDPQPNNPDTPSGPTGKLTFATSGTSNSSTKIQEYDFAVGRPAQLITGYEGTRLPNGEIFFIRAEWTTDEVRIGTANGATSTKLFEANCSNGLSYPQVNAAGDRFALTAYYRCTQIPGAPQYGTFVMNRSGQIVARYDSVYQGTFAANGTMVFTGAIDEGNFSAAIIPSASRGEGLYRVNPGGGRPVKIPVAVDKPLYPAISPDGSKVAFSLNDHIWVVNIDGSGLRQVTSGSRSETYPVWSPNGSLIACLCYGTDFPGALFGFNVVSVVPANATTEMINSAPVYVQDPTSSNTGNLMRGDGPLTWR